MKIDLDPEYLKVSVDMWRKTTDLEVDLAPEFRSHFISNRGVLLEGFVKIAINWLTVLRQCKATGDDLAELQALTKEIESFKTWAQDGLIELAKLELEE